MMEPDPSPHHPSVVGMSPEYDGVSKLGHPPNPSLSLFKWRNPGLVVLMPMTLAACS